MLKVCMCALTLAFAMTATQLNAQTAEIMSVTTGVRGSPGHNYSVGDEIDVVVEASFDSNFSWDPNDGDAPDTTFYIRIAIKDSFGTQVTATTHFFTVAHAQIVVDDGRLAYTVPSVNPLPSGYTADVKVGVVTSQSPLTLSETDTDSSAWWQLQ